LDRAKSDVEKLKKLVHGASLKRLVCTFYNLVAFVRISFLLSLIHAAIFAELKRMKETRTYEDEAGYTSNILADDVELFMMKLAALLF
jgi:hypothetical protein